MNCRTEHEVPDYGPYARKDWPAPDRGQAAMITRLDSYVGRMLEQLRLLGLAEKTLVIFTSDNGPHNESNHDLSRFQPAGPLSGIKRSLKDGGIRVPLIAWWPGKVPAGVENPHVGYFGDWFATAVDLAGVPVPPQLDSVSLVPTLSGRDSEQTRHEFLYWEFHEGGFTQAALYNGRWKGIRTSPQPGSLVLYDVANDVAEKTDIAAQHPEIVGRVEAYLDSARSETAEWQPKWADRKTGDRKIGDRRN